MKIRKEDINSTTINLFVQLFSKTSLPFHLLENPPFRTFLKNTANLSYIPSGYGFKKAITVRSESYKHNLIENCSKIKHLSLSLDFWKYSDYNIGCVPIKFWKDEVLTNKIISIESLVDTKAQTLFDHIKTLLIAFQIYYNKILTTCTDNCNAMLSFGSLFETQKRSEIVFDLLEEEKQEECDEVIKTLEICLKNSTRVGCFVYLLQTAMKNSIS